MQREIKFRAWDGLKIIYPDSDGWFNGCKFPNEHILQMCRLDIALKNLEVMQYTGLKDKNGKEIHEGDIIKLIDNQEGDSLFEIKFDQGAFQGIHRAGVGRGIAWRELLRDLPAWIHQEIEVIGNIYENPELLTNKKD